MQLSEESQESEQLTVSTLKLNLPSNNDAANISESDTEINKNTHKLMINNPNNNKSYYSENDDEWEYEDNHIQTVIASTNSPSHTFKPITRSRSDISSLVHRSRSKYDKKKSNKKPNQTLDDMKIAYLKERKQRRKDKKQYQRMSQQFHETITKTADDYEDQLKQNETELQQEYEAKLIQAEIKRNQSEQQITALNAEVHRLQQLITTNTISRTSTPAPTLLSHRSNQSVHSLISIDAEIGPPRQVHQHINAVVSPRHNMRNNNHTYTYSNSNVGTPTSAQMVHLMNNHAYSFSSSIQSNVNNVVDRADMHHMDVNNNNNTNNNNNNFGEGDIATNRMNIHNGNSMQHKLKMAMSPSLHYNHEYVASFGNIGATQKNNDHEGTDEDDMVVFDGYNNYRNNENNNMDKETDSESIKSETPVPPPKKKKRKKKQKRKKKKTKSEDAKSFWDFLVKCVTPSICDKQSV